MRVRLQTERKGSGSDPRGDLGVTPWTGMKHEVENWAVKIGSGVQGGIMPRSLGRRQGCQDLVPPRGWWYGTEVVRGLKG